MKLIDFANTPDDEYAYLNEEVLASASHGNSYLLTDIELPKGCTPRKIKLQISYMDEQYWLDLPQAVTCPQNIGKLYQLAELSCMHFADFDEMADYMRTLCRRGIDVDTDALHKMEYMTKDGRLNLQFEFHEVSHGDWRIYILSDIDYRSRSSTSNDAHWLMDSSRGCRYICWNQTLHSLADAKNVAQVWSEVTAYYIRRGGNFPAIAQKLGYA